MRKDGVLGGVWTNSLLGYLLDFDKSGFNQELVRKLDEHDARVLKGSDEGFGRGHVANRECAIAHPIFGKHSYCSLPQRAARFGGMARKLRLGSTRAPAITPSMRQRPAASVPWQGCGGGIRTLPRPVLASVVSVSSCKNLTLEKKKWGKKKEETPQKTGTHWLLIRNSALSAASCKIRMGLRSERRSISELRISQEVAESAEILREHRKCLD